MRKRSRAAASPPRPAGAAPRRTTKAERRAAKAALAGARAAARHMKTRFPDAGVPRLLGVAALARAMRPRPPVPSRIWMRGDVVLGEDGRFTIQANPRGGTEVTVISNPHTPPAPSYHNPRHGYAGPAAWELTMTLDMETVDYAALSDLFNLPESKEPASE